jgi:prepilin-type N-terminal cleavage/methylation domain-containing protein
MQTKTHKGFTLIEIIIALAILSVLSSVGVISYNGYMESSRDKVAEENYRNIINTMNSEFLKCRIDDNATIYESHNCSASSSPGINDLKDYFTNNLNMKNPYNQSLPVIGSNVCEKGTIVIANSSSGTYDVSYASSLKKKAYSRQVNSTWSSNYTKTNTSSISYSCGKSSSSSTAVGGSFATYKPPHNGSGAGIIVDKNGNMVKGQGAHACSPDCFKVDQGGMKNWYFMVNGQKQYPARSGGQYRFVMAEGASKSGNIASSCSGGNCKYNFSNNTYKVLNSGQTFKAGVSPGQRQPINP